MSRRATPKKRVQTPHLEASDQNPQEVRTITPRVWKILGIVAVIAVALFFLQAKPPSLPGDPSLTRQAPIEIKGANTSVPMKPANTSALGQTLKEKLQVK